MNNLIFTCFFHMKEIVKNQYNNHLLVEMVFIIITCSLRWFLFYKIKISYLNPPLIYKWKNLFIRLPIHKRKNIFTKLNFHSPIKSICVYVFSVEFNMDTASMSFTFLRNLIWTLCSRFLTSMSSFTFSDKSNWKL